MTRGNRWCDRMLDRRLPLSCLVVLAAFDCYQRVDSVHILAQGGHILPVLVLMGCENKRLLYFMLIKNIMSGIFYVIL